MRYTKNSLAADLVYLGILFDVLYFVNIYQSDVGTYYYNYIIGISIIYNLVFMLASFLASEGVKHYQKNYSWLLLGLGAGQIIRIFILPKSAHAATTMVNGESVLVMHNGQYITVLVYLILSALCLAAAAAVTLVKCRELDEHMKYLETQKA